MTSHRILITGSAGTVGKAVSAELKAAGHFVRGYDRSPTENVDESITADITDRTALSAAVKNVDTIIHLAAALEWLDFLNDQVGPNLVAPYYLFEAAREHRTQRVLLASTIQVAGHFIKDSAKHPLRIETGTSPYNTYGATKVFLEELGKMYARNEKISVLAARLCWVPRSIEEVQKSKPHNRNFYYLSHRDVARFFRAAVESTNPALAPGTFHATYVVSKTADGSPQRFDTSPTEALLNWSPQDSFPHGLPADWPLDNLC